ncbi:MULTISPECIES: LPS export ABC transporter permease LptG [unclassified Agarivorans]|uniref:LPS export ABC transporter permease LptG n=1 Tax=unclassified Agarivorans TaxID=2636026 RepID=UPI0026E1F7D6|nr:MULTISPECIES: LPS export ABC transporter permease LptG [unclassified Agarivorans]MDO6685224.1 LPS export ABC transporter permease LptG [Agarivorans sp. 3_MG-2023]MDO6715604.1 LPS export ABC transporter permease LptG [Agarivorans sp. 2_MG-2023]MDO6763751.1 LPS export ABC transporter permease LptG [Agarivorans sp. 1_MG-2023]
MFRILDWYVGRTIIMSSLLVLVTLQSLSMIVKFVEQMGSVGQGDYQIADALWYVLLSVPRELEIFFPMAALLGSLIGLGSLASTSELVVMQSAGLSRFNIAVAVLKTAVPMMIVMMLLGEYVAPQSDMAAKELRSSKMSGGAMVAVQRGVWAKDGESFVNIGEVQENKELFNITIYRFNDDADLYQQVEGNQAYYDKNRWLIREAKVIDFSDNGVTEQLYEDYPWSSTLTPDKLSVVTIKPHDLSITGMYSYIAYLKQNRQDPARYELALARKLMMPILTGIMMLLALSFVFGPLRSSSMGAKIMLGVVAGFSYYILDQVLGSMSLVYGVHPYISAAIPSVLVLGIAFFLINRRT